MVRLFGRKKEKVEAGVERTRRTWFGRIAGLLDRSKIDDELWEELEEALIGADVGVDLTMRLLERVKERGRQEGANDGASVRVLLQEELVRILDAGHGESALTGDGDALSLPAKPYVILVVGVNGVGKTTSIAKLAHLLVEDGKKVLLAAGDTFRAAAIEQLEIWASRTDVEIVAHKRGADPGAVVFDSLQAATARSADAVVIDTAGRLHTKANLMEELKKVHRVIQRFDPEAPHETVLVMDATTGQNGVIQAKYFAEAVGVTGLFLAKLDGTAKGGVVLAIAEQLGLPILFVGTGEGLEDLAPFDAKEFVEALFSREA